MFSDTFIKKLKQTNVSINADKTKSRMSEVWKSASRAQQNAILELSGVARPTVHRAYKVGNISAKLVIPVAQTMNVSPFYLTGEADDRAECTDDLLHKFLKKHNYASLLEEAPKRKGRKKSAAAKAKKAPKAAKAPAKAAKSAPVDEPVFDASLTEDEMIILMKSILLRAKTGGKYAKLAADLKKLLMS